jgi:hypothetical protein
MQIAGTEQNIFYAAARASVHLQTRDIGMKKNGLNRQGDARTSVLQITDAHPIAAPS